MMKSIVFIVPYFGKFPNYFQLWLNSCKENSTINWLIITDIEDKYDYPSNVMRVKMTFDELKAFIQSKYDFKIGLQTPYKLCDFRPAYGDIFQDYIKDYDYWGYCDVDLIWGDIRKFLTDDLLNKDYDRLFNLGHCTLYRNSEDNNSTYRTVVADSLTYKEILSSPFNFVFDEILIIEMYAKLSKSVYSSHVCYDVCVKKLRFQPSDETIKNTICKSLVGRRGIFLKNKEGIFFYYIQEGKILSKEFMYVHLQKRKMAVDLKHPYPSEFCIIPNRFVSNMEMSEKNIKLAQPKTLIYWDYLKMYCKQVLDVLFDRPRAVILPFKKERLIAKLFHRTKYLKFIK